MMTVEHDSVIVNARVQRYVSRSCKGDVNSRARDGIARVPTRRPPS
jgi:hypothetical protein